MSCVFLILIIGILSDKKVNSFNIKLFVFLVGVFSIEFILRRINSPTPDLFAGLIPFYVFIRLICSTELELQSEEKKYANTKIIFLFIATIYTITIKLSSIPFLLLPLMILYFNKNLINKRTNLLMLFSALLIIGPWIIRNYILSGYLIYPFSSLDLFNPDWKIPLESVKLEEQIIVNAARLLKNSELLSSSATSLSWFLNWLTNRPCPRTIILLLVPIGILITLLKCKILFRDKNLMSFYICCVIGIVFWFLTAPDIRFAYSFIGAAIFFPFLVFNNKKVMLMLAVFPVLICSLSLLYIPFNGKIILIFVFIELLFFISLNFLKKIDFVCLFSKLNLMIFTIVFLFLGLMFLYQNKKFLENNIFIKTLPQSYYAKDVNQRPYKFISHKIGDKIIFTPSGGEGCYDCVLPCANEFNHNLKMRGQSFQEGFYIQK